MVRLPPRVVREITSSLRVEAINAVKDKHGVTMSVLAEGGQNNPLLTSGTTYPLGPDEMCISVSIDEGRDLGPFWNAVDNEEKRLLAKFGSERVQ